MTANAENNGRDNIFRDYDLELLEEFARNQYRMLQEETQPDAYWLFEECLRQMAKKERQAPRDRRDYLVETFGFDPKRLELAATIRDRHDTTLGLQCMSMEEGLGRKQESAGKSDGDGGALRPYDRLPGAESFATERERRAGRQADRKPGGDSVGRRDDGRQRTATAFRGVPAARRVALGRLCRVGQGHPRRRPPGIEQVGNGLRPSGPADPGPGHALRAPPGRAGRGRAAC